MLLVTDIKIGVQLRDYIIAFRESQLRLPRSCHVNLILFRITFGLDSRLNPFERIQRLINSNSVKVRLTSVATIKLCRGCFNSPTVEDSFFALFTFL